MSKSLEIIETPSAKDSLLRLPKSIQKLYVDQCKRIRTNLNDPRLHLKKLRGLDDTYSFRITRAYRALFYFQTNNKAIIFAIGHRKDIYR